MMKMQYSIFLLCFQRPRLLEASPCRIGVPELQTNAIPMTVKKGSTSGRLQRLLCNSGIPLCFEIGTHIQRGVARFDTNLQKWWSR